MARVITTESITNTEISELRAEALEMGDYMMAAICDLAIDGEIDCDDYSTLEHDEDRKLRAMNQDGARAECAKVINYAAACAAMYAAPEPD